MPQLFRHTSIVLVQKKGAPNEIGHSRGGASTKIHAAVDSYGYTVYILISEDSAMISIMLSHYWIV